jgi:phage terminase large subunit
MYQITTATKRLAGLKKRIKAIQGGTSASKTVSIILLLIHKAQSDKIPTLTSVVSESFPHLRRGAMRDFTMIMESHHYFKNSDWDKTNSTYTFETGSKIEFFSADQWEKVKGARRDRLFINEADHTPYETFNQLELRTKDEIWLDWNPTNEFWFYDQVKMRPDVDHLILTYKDNEALSQSIVDSLEQRMNNVSWWKVYGLGQLGEIESRIYKDWEIIDKIPHEAQLVRYGLDFGYTNDPASIVAVYYYNGGYVLDQITYQKGLSNKLLADIIISQNKALVVADSAEPKSIDEISSYGVDIVGVEKTRGMTKLDTFIKWSVGIVQSQRISLTKDSVDTIKEYRNYIWLTNRDGKIINEEDPRCANHSMSAIRYAFVNLQSNARPDPRQYYEIQQKREEHRNEWE